MTLPDDLRGELRRMEERLGVRNNLLVVWADPVTDEWRDQDGDPIDRNDVHPETQLVVIREHLVMPRDQADREGRDILGPCEDAPPKAGMSSWSTRTWATGTHHGVSNDLAAHSCDDPR